MNSFYQKYGKRSLDIILSAIALLFLSPVLLVVALMVRVKLGSPVLFKQQRPGLNEKVFGMYKFRSMTSETDEKGNLLPDAVRLTPFGIKLRRTSLDELPSLWNILKGDMSIVGPRPLVVRYLPFYTKEEQLRHSVRPGLTGLAQVNGRNLLGWDDRLALDVVYVKTISFINDLKIVLQTVEKVIKKKDIVMGNELPMKSLDAERLDKQNELNEMF